MGYSFYKILPTESEFDKANKGLLDYSVTNQTQWSEPKFVCPSCNAGGMRKDLTTICTSIPPSFKYQCTNCGHVTYKHY